MSGYRLIIHCQDQRWGQFDSEGPQAREHLIALAARLPDADGFRLQWQQAVGEQRLLHSGPDGLKVLSSEPVYRDMPAP